MAHQVVSIQVCEMCRHAKSLHEVRQIRGVPPDLLLHARCLAAGCTCTGYTGVLWERLAPIAVHRLVQIPV